MRWSPGGGVEAPHETDRALRELLEETRIAAMGGQISLGFLLAVAYTPAIRSVPDGDRTLYAAAVVMTAAAVVLLLAPVAVHRINFGRRMRERILIADHVVTLVGLGCLGAGIVLSLALAAQMALAAWTFWIAGLALGLVVSTWLVLPLVLRGWDGRDAQRSPDALPEGREGPA